MYQKKCHYSNQYTYTSNSLLMYILELLLYKTIMTIKVIDVFDQNPF